MPLRNIQGTDPLSAQSRTRAALSAGDIETLRGDFQSDKSIKDSKIATLEADKTTQDDKIQTLENDKNDKDTRMNTAETNITLIDGRVTTLEAEQQGIIEGGRAEILTGTFTSVNGGNADLSA